MSPRHQHITWALIAISLAFAGWWVFFGPGQAGS
jgi:hypothetical protein